MNKIRSLLWHVGIPLNWLTCLWMIAMLLTFLSLGILGFFPLLVANHVVRTLIFLMGAPGLLMTIGGSYRLVFWALLDKAERRDIERRLMMRLLRLWLRENERQ